MTTQLPDIFSPDFERKMQRFDESIDRCIAKFEQSFPKHVNDEIAAIQFELGMVDCEIEDETERP